MKPQTIDHIGLKLEVGNHIDTVVALAVSKDGRTLVSAGDYTLRVWDVASRKLLRQILGHRRSPDDLYASSISAMALSPDGRWAVSVKAHSRIEVFDVNTGNLLSAFERADYIFSVAFSPDGRWLALGVRRDDDETQTWGVVDLVSARALLKAGFERPPAPEHTHRLAHRLGKVGLDIDVRWMPVPRTDRRSKSQSDADYGLAVTAQSPGDRINGRLHWLAFQPGLGLQDLHSYEADGPLVSGTLAVSPGAVVVATKITQAGEHPDRWLSRLIALDHQAQFVSQTALEQQPSAVAFSSDGQSLAVGMWGFTSDVDVLCHLTVALALGPSGFKRRSTYYGHDAGVKAVTWLNKDTVLSAGGFDNAIHSWSPSTLVGVQKDPFRGVGQGQWDYQIDALDQLRFNTVLMRQRLPHQTKPQLRFDLRALQLLAAEPDEPVPQEPINARWRPYDGSAQIIDLGHEPDATHRNDDTYFSHLQLSLFIGTDDVWVLWTRSGFYATNAPDKLSRIGFCVDRGPRREALYLPADRFPIFDNEAIVRAVVQHGSEARARANGVDIPHVNVADLLPPVVEVQRVTVDAARTHATLHFELEPPWGGQGTTRLWVLRNKRFLWFEDKAKALRRRRWRVKLRLNPGPNVFTIHAECATAKSVPCEVQVAGPPQPDAKVAHQSNKGKLFLLSVGVSDFEIAGKEQAGATLPLDYAHRDATAVYNVLAGSRHAARRDPKMPLRNAAFDSVAATLLTNQQATKAAILDQVRQYADQIKQRERDAAAERDVLLVFLSGHGVRFTDDPELYFWNWDLIRSVEDIDRSGLSLIEFAEIATAVPAEVVLVIDACHSGMAGNNMVRGLDPEELARRIRAVHERGLYVINASRSEQLSKESSKLRHGLLTHALLQALRDPDFANGPDGGVSMADLIAAIQALVPRIAARLGIKKPQTPTCRTYGDLVALTIFQPSPPGRAISSLRNGARSDSVPRPSSNPTRGRTSPMATKNAAAKKAAAKKAPAKKAAVKKAAPAKKAVLAKRAAPAKKVAPAKRAKPVRKNGDKPGEDLPRRPS